MDNMFVIFEVGLGVYILYGAIMKSGQMFKNENIKKGMEEQYRKLIRLFSFILGPLMVALGVVDYFNIRSGNGGWNIPLIVLWGLTFIGMVFLFVFALRMTDRSKKQQSAGRPRGEKPAPRAAFEFDEEEKKPSAPNKRGGDGNKKD